MLPASESARADGGPIRRWLGDSTALDLALRLTLLDLLLVPIGKEWIKLLALGIAGAGLILPGLHRSRALWASLALLTGLRVALDYPLADNHAYLLCYWCATLALGLASSEPDRAIAVAARVLIGLAFGFAALWKLALSPDFLDGTFFRVTLLTDPRFADLARIAGGLTPESLATMREALLQHADLEVAAWTPLPEPARLRALATAMTLWTAFIEAAVAVAFLWASFRGPSRFADALLLVFCATTYAVAPVAGFGWLLLAMGSAQCAPTAGRVAVRVFYLATYALVLLYREVPWLDWIADRVASA